MRRKISKIALLAAFVVALAIPTLGSADGMNGMMETTRAKKGMSVKLKAKPDAMAGYNLRVKTKKFTWAPKRVNRKHRKWEGHAHLYIDEVKITRLYGPDFYLGNYYLGSLTPGEHEVEVGLNANDHSAYARKGGKLIEDSVTITVP